MLKALKKKLKDQRGLTLVELLAVIVILGIISGIAVPSIGKIIENTKTDAHVANAQQMVSAARLAISSDDTLLENTHYLTLGYMEAEEYLEKVKDPDKTTGGYLSGGTVKLTSLTETNANSFVKVVDGKVVSVKLINGKRGVQTPAKKPVSIENLEKGTVNKN